MSRRVTEHPVVVLKFGSSVLTDAERIRAVGQEIVRMSGSHRVVAVVSALPGRTDELMGTAREVSDRTDSPLLAALLATGEDAAVALVGMGVQHAGGSVSTMTSAELAIRTTGPLLDAEPVDWDPSRVHAAHRDGDVVVVPGFVGRDAAGARSILGRGGSDLTALFLATRLEADTCRLIKDVDGLYTGDPNLSTDVRRYATATWSRALAVGKQVIQPKAVRFAERHGLEFALTALAASGETRVGHGPDALMVEGEYLAESVSG